MWPPVSAGAGVPLELSHMSGGGEGAAARVSLRGIADCSSVVPAFVRLSSSCGMLRHVSIVVCICGFTVKHAVFAAATGASCTVVADTHQGIVRM